MKRLVIVLAVLAALFPVPSGAQSDMAAVDGYMDFLTHVQDSASNLPTEPEGMVEFAESETEWALANPPSACYADTWGRYLVLMERTRTLGWAISNTEVATATFLMDDFEAMTEAMTDSIMESTTECSING